MGGDGEGMGFPARTERDRAYRIGRITVHDDLKKISPLTASAYTDTKQFPHEESPSMGTDPGMAMAAATRDGHVPLCFLLLGTETGPGYAQGPIGGGASRL